MVRARPDYTVFTLPLLPPSLSPPPPPAQCKKEAKGLELVSIEEYDVCKYKMKLSLPQWCNVKE